MSSSDADENTPLLNNGANGAAATATDGSNPAAAPAAAGGENAASDAHVAVSMTSDDDELLDDSSTGQEAVSGTSREAAGGGRQWSFNPFDRLVQSGQSGRRDVEEGGNADSPYSPIGEEHGAAGSTWNRFLR